MSDAADAIAPPATKPPPLPPAVTGLSSGDSLARTGTPTRERQELWELLDLPSDGRTHASGWHKLLEATRTNRVVGQALQNARDHEGKIVELLNVCFESIAENTLFVSEAKKQFAVHSQMLGGVAQLQEQMKQCQQRCEIAEQDNASLRRAIAENASSGGVEAGAGSSTQPSKVVPLAGDGGAVRGAAGAMEARLRRLEAAQEQHMLQLQQAWHHIATEDAADHAVHEHFHSVVAAAAAITAPSGPVERRPGSSSGSSSSAGPAPAVPIAPALTEHLEAAMVQTAHKRRRSTLHSVLQLSPSAGSSASAAAAPPPQVLPGEPPAVVEEGPEGEAAHESEEAVAAAAAPVSEDDAPADPPPPQGEEEEAAAAAAAPNSPAVAAADSSVLAQLTQDKLSRKMMVHRRTEALADAVAALSAELSDSSRRLQTEMVGVRHLMKAGLQTPPPTPDVGQMSIGRTPQQQAQAAEHVAELKAVSQRHARHARPLRSADHHAPPRPLLLRSDRVLLPWPQERQRVEAHRAAAAEKFAQHDAALAALQESSEAHESTLGTLAEAQAQLRADLTVAAQAAQDSVSQAFPSWNRSILAEIYLCHTCSCHEIEDANGRAGGGRGADDPGRRRARTAV
jgi:hypothetical protein